MVKDHFDNTFSPTFDLIIAMQKAAFLNMNIFHYL